MMYKAAVQTVLIYGSEIWVVIDAMLKVLEGFHHQVTWRIAGMEAWQVGEGGWEWLLVVEALEATGMCPMKDFICRRKDTIEEHIANHPIYELCMGAEKIPGSISVIWWWDQDLNQEEEGNGDSEVAERELG